MKSSCRLIKGSIFVIIVMLFITIRLTFFANENDVINYINNICLNILAGAFILLATSINEYFINRRKVLEKLINHLNNIKHIFDKIKYIEKTEFIDYKEYMINENLTENELAAHEILEFQKKCDLENSKRIINFDDVIESYKNIASIDLVEFWNVYEEINFLFNNKRNKKIYHKEVFSKIEKEVEECKVINYHIYKYEKQNVNPLVLYDIISDYQKTIFCLFDIKIQKKLSKKNHEKIKKISSYTYSISNNIMTVRYNKFAENLRDELSKIAKTTYFNDEYEFYKK